MEKLFIQAVNLSISASWLVLAVLMLRFLLKKAPKWLNMALWSLVAVRLLLPFSWESVLSLLPSAQTIPEGFITDPNPGINSGLPAVDQLVNPMLQQQFTPAPGASANPLQIWTAVLSVLWLAGIGLMLLYTLVTYLRLRHRVRTAVLLSGNLYQSEAVSSPFVLGLIRPRIYLPFCVKEEDLAYVVAHEKAHIARRDHWWKPLGFVLLSIYWFNPVLWVAYIFLCRDIELACDERVIRDRDMNYRANYSQALLSCSVSRRSIAACPLAFGEVGVKQRIKSVLNYKKPAFWIILVALLASVALAVGFLTSPKEEYRDPALAWIEDLRQEEVADILLDGNTLTPDQIRDFTEQLRRSRLTPTQEPPLEPGNRLVSAQMDLADGSYHSIRVCRDRILCIDGVYYLEENPANDWAQWDAVAVEALADARPDWIQNLEGGDVKEIRLETGSYSTVLTGDEVSMLVTQLRIDRGQKISQAPAVTDPTATLELRMQDGRTHLVQYQKHVYIDGDAYTMEAHSFTEWMDWAYLAQHGQAAAQLRQLCRELEALPAGTTVTALLQDNKQTWRPNAGILEAIREINGYVWPWNPEEYRGKDCVNVDIPLENGSKLQVQIGETFVIVNDYLYVADIGWNRNVFRMLRESNDVQRDTEYWLKWAHDLKAEDVQKIEVYLWTPGGTTYGVLTEQQISQAVDMIHGANGEVVTPEPIGGNCIELAITTQDGSLYRMTNHGNCYWSMGALRYQADPQWLESWFTLWASVAVEPLASDEIL